MQNSASSATAWDGYVCPKCRFVFRIQRGQNGEGTVCPSCQNLLRVPHLGEVTPAPLPSSKEYQNLENIAESSAQTSSRNSRKKHSEQAWEKQGSEVDIALAKTEGLPWIWIAPFTLLACGIIGLLGWYTLADPPEPATPPKATQLAKKDTKITEPTPSSEETNLNVFQYNTNRDEPILLALFKAFVTAKEPQDLNAIIRPTDLMEELWETLHEPANQRAPVASLNSVSGVIGLPNWIVCTLIDKNHKQRIYFVEHSNGEFLIDLESSLGRSDMDWENFKTSKTSTPTWMRATCSPAYYFNYDLFDEKTYRCVRLESPDQQHVLYGYVPVTSPLVTQLLPLFSEYNRTLAIVSVHFPEDPSSPDQVYIKDVKGHGWIAP